MTPVWVLVAEDAAICAGMAAGFLRWVSGIRKRRLADLRKKYQERIGKPDDDGWRPLARYWK